MRFGAEGKDAEEMISSRRRMMQDFGNCNKPQPFDFSIKKIRRRTLIVRFLRINISCDTGHGCTVENRKQQRDKE